MTLTIYPVTTIEDCHHLETLQLEIWRCDPVEVVPDGLMLTIAKNGGIVLAAKEGDRMVGFAFSFQGQTAAGRRKHASHMAGVIPGLECQGIGALLKLAQREVSLAQGITLMTWTYDPLISRNANFNLRKLGATSRTYYRNLYGVMRDGLNEGLPSDRLEVEWEMDSEPVLARIAGALPPVALEPSGVLNPAPAGPATQLPVPAEVVNLPAGPRHFIRIPAQIEAIKAADVSLAQAWRSQTRDLFEIAFAAGYAAVDFIRAGAEGYYVLENAVGRK